MFDRSMALLEVSMAVWHKAHVLKGVQGWYKEKPESAAERGARTPKYVQTALTSAD